jgi:NDP-sugar pyrophosphorylase family protein
MLKVIIPLAGSSELFTNSGHLYPKPLIEINGTPMIQHVVQHIDAPRVPCQFIFIIKDNEAVKFHLDNTLRLLTPDCEIVKLKKDTKGGLCSVLMAIEKISDNDSLIVLNGDQIIQENFNDIYRFWLNNNASAGVVTFHSVHPRWSYVRTEKGEVVQTAEKNPISTNAIAGYYYFENAALFFECAFQVIKNDVQLDGNYYISPVLNEYILRNKKVITYPIKPEHYHSFYSPQMVNKFEKITRLLNEQES